MASFTALPLSLTAGTQIKAKVQARNPKGWGAESTASTDLIYVQTAPPAIVYDLAAVNDLTGANLTWSVINKATWEVSSYNIYWDQGIGTWAVKTTSITESAQITLTTGFSYSFKVTAVNAYGESPVSNVISVRTALKPSNMSPVTVSQTGTDIIISWTAPNENGSPITSYTLKILNFLLNDYVEYQNICNGSSPTVISNRACPPIPMTTFTNTLNYPINRLIKAVVQATNDLGSNDFSTPNTVGIVTQDRPQVAVVVTFTATQTSVTLSWNALTLDADLGYAPLI